MVLPAREAQVRGIQTNDDLPACSFGTDVPEPVASVIDLFDEQVRRQPEAVAVEHGARSMSYAELDVASAALAARLREHGIGRGDVVGVFLQRSVEMVIGILAVLRTGAAYAPQDIRISPRTLLRHVVSVAGMRVVLTTGDLSAAVPDGPAVVLVEADGPHRRGCLLRCRGRPIPRRRRTRRTRAPSSSPPGPPASLTASW